MTGARTTTSEAPLLAWGDALRKRRERRRRLALRAIALALCTAPLLATIAWQPAPRFVWNGSRSSPIGLYLVRRDRPARVGDLVVTWLPGPARRLANARQYLPARVPLVKRVAATGGSLACTAGHAILVDGRIVARRLDVDQKGRTLPSWSGCRRLRGGQLLLVSSHPSSFDGRYFGPIEPPAILGRAVRIWPR